MKVQLERRPSGGAARRRDQGAVLVEYALLIVLIAIACLVAIRFFGGETNETLSDVGRSVAEASP